ncbi:uncharacterized protein LOC110464218 [Mizuhopecten yessoensis]|uniref:uncharacterized protein LOC110464218 n=1 Tax=Mizuhopecten yessoensis TaxID=6573 RepID=UPI000B45C12F|nr:uncharacterized protein LOC110464218 [Mizuhopecten yessoensis]
MSGTVNTNSSCFTDVPGEVVYDPMYDRIVYFKDSSIWGCSFGGVKTELYRFASRVSVGHFAYDNEDRLLFYVLDGVISTLKLDDDSTKPTIVLTTTNVTRIALDPVNKELYWVNLHTRQIERANYNGTSRSYFSSISNNGDVPTIVISGGFAFWIDTKVSGIRRQNISDTAVDDTLSYSISCTTIFVVGDWIYCLKEQVYQSGVLRLEKNGKCGGYHGPFHEYSQTVIHYNGGPNTDLEPSCKFPFISFPIRQMHAFILTLCRSDCVTCII